MSHDEFPQVPDPARQRAESIDACRSGSQDWHDEEIAQHVGTPQNDKTLARSLELDEEIHAAYQDVPIPAGLEARLLEKLAPQQKNSHRMRRVLLTLAATAAALIIAYQFLTSVTSSRIDVEKLVNEVSQSGWKRPTPSVVCQAKLHPTINPRRWKTIELNGISVTFFEFSVGGITGYVASYPTNSLDRDFPRTPTIGTRGYCHGESHFNGMTHVLIVEGGVGDYQRFVPTSHLT